MRNCASILASRKLSRTHLLLLLLLLLVSARAEAEAKAEAGAEKHLLSFADPIRPDPIRLDRLG